MDAKARTTVVLTMLVGCVLAHGCTAPGDAGSASGALSRQTLDRVVIARMYQRDGWVIRGVDPAVDRAAAAQYVCDAIAPLHPSYVSGLIRLSAEDTISEEQADVFRRVRHCIESRRQHAIVPHPVRFDVVLNALDYTDGTPEQERCGPPVPAQRSADDLTRLLRARRRSIESQLDPDGYFFDFYSEPFRYDDVRDHGPWRPRVLADEIPRMQHDGLFVGGNVWGSLVPPGSDFVAITDKTGREGVIEQSHRLQRQGVPVLLHIRNDPHIDGSGGREWNEGTHARRLRVLRQHVRWAEAAGDTYMFPVFFPLYPNADEAGTPACERHRPWSAYDATQDGEILSRMADYLDRGERSAHFRSSASEDAAPSAHDPDDDGHVLVHRAARPESAQHLYSISPVEIDEDRGLSLEIESYFGLARTFGADVAPLFRCALPSGERWLTTSTSCDATRGAVPEGVLGFVGTSAIDGMVPLHRTFRPGTATLPPDHFYTTSAAERDAAAIYGYRADGIVGYVYDDAAMAVPETPAAPAPTARALTTILRGVHDRTGQHLYSGSATELASAPGIVTEPERFALGTNEEPGLVPFYRCYLGNGWHLETTSSTCEGASATNEGALGFIATAPIDGALPLVRLFRGGARPDHFYTTSLVAVRDAIAAGYTSEGVAGYVFAAP